jgi:hypothetical protein
VHLRAKPGAAGFGSRANRPHLRYSTASSKPVVSIVRDISRAALECLVCAAIILVCANAVVRAQEPSQSDNYTASMLQICRLYTNATAQTGMPADLLFQQCMAERHCRISPRSTAYQCEPPGPMIIRPGA